MDATQMIEKTFLELEQDLERAIEGLTPNELAWRPNMEANGIGFTFWHVSRAEDNWVAGFALQQPTIFARDGWAEKWSIPAEDTGFGYGPEQLAAFPALPVDEVWEYRRTVRRQSLGCLKTLKPADFDYSPPTDHPQRQGYNIGRMFTHLICEIGQHVGHIFYLRGLQRGINR